MELKDWKNFEEILKNVRETADRFATTITNTEQAIIFETSYVQELAHYYRTHRFDEALALVPRINEMLERYDSVIVIEFKIEMLFTISKIYFYTGDLDKALDWSNRIVFEDLPNAADDVICFTRILNLLIHYDLGNYDLLKYEIKSTRRFLIKKKRLFLFEDLVLRNINRLIGIRDESKKMEAYIAFHIKLEETFKEEFEGNAQSYLNLANWLQSKIEKRPVIDIIMETKAEEI